VQKASIGEQIKGFLLSGTSGYSKSDYDKDSKKCKSCYFSKNRFL